MIRRYKYTITAAVLLGVAVYIVLWRLHEANVCESRGGKYVATWSWPGWTCIGR